MEAVYIKNRKASFDYIFIKEYTAGIQLFGTEVKSIRDGKVSLVDSFCYFKNGELFMKGVNIAVGKTSYTHEPLRDRKLLLNRKELNKLENEMERGMTIIVKKFFSTKENLIKAEIALAKGKKDYDKREALKDKDVKREMKNIY
jgi:SsrA-binding protein